MRKYTYKAMAELLICGKVRAADMGRSVGRVSAEMKDLLPEMCK